MIRTIRIATLFAISLAGGVNDLAGQTGVIRGRVVRADGLVGLGGAELVLNPSGAITRSDARGDFTFRAVAPGQVEVAARRPGFVPAIVTLNEADVLRGQMALDYLAATVKRDWALARAWLFRELEPEGSG